MRQILFLPLSLAVCLVMGAMQLMNSIVWYGTMIILGCGMGLGRSQAVAATRTQGEERTG